MTEVRLVLKLLDRNFLFRVILALLLYSLVPLGEIFLFLYLGDLIGNYLILLLAAVAGLPGVLIALGQIRRTLDHLKAKIRDSAYPGGEFVDLVGILIGSLLLLTPGFVTDVVGYLLLVPFLRDRLAKVIARKLDSHFREVYEYLKLSGV